MGPKWDKSGAFSDQISVHLALKSDLKKPPFCHIWGQSDPLWNRTYNPWCRESRGADLRSSSGQKHHVNPQPKHAGDWARISVPLGNRAEISVRGSWSYFPDLDHNNYKTKPSRPHSQTACDKALRPDHTHNTLTVDDRAARERINRRGGISCDRRSREDNGDHFVIDIRYPE